MLYKTSKIQRMVINIGPPGPRFNRTEGLFTKSRRKPHKALHLESKSNNCIKKILRENNPVSRFFSAFFFCWEMKCFMLDEIDLDICSSLICNHFTHLFFFSFFLSSYQWYHFQGGGGGWSIPNEIRKTIILLFNSCVKDWMTWRTIGLIKMQMLE